MAADRRDVMDNDGVSRRYRLRVDQATVSRTVEERLGLLQRKVRLKGFRPGHAPMAMVRRLHQEGVTSAVLEQLAVRTAGEMIQRDGLRPLGRPMIRKTGTDPSGDYEFDCSFETLPEIVLLPVENLVVTRLVVTDRVPVAMPDAATEPVGPTGERAGGPLGRDTHALTLDVDDTEQIERFCREYETRQVLDWLADHYDFPVPPTMLANELVRIVRRHTEQFLLEPDERLHARYAAIAARRTRLALLLVEIGRVHGIQVPYSEIEALIRADSPTDDGRQEELVRFYAANPTALAELHSTVFERRVVEFLMQSAQIVEQSVTAAEIPDIVAAVVPPHA